MTRYNASLLFVLTALLLAQPATSVKLTQISSREFVDLSKLSFVRLPAYTPAPPGCPDCQTRWGADMTVDGVMSGYTEEAEAYFRRALGALGQ